MLWGRVLNFRSPLISPPFVSRHTIASYRDTFKLFLKFAHRRTGKFPSDLRLEDFDAEMVVACLDDLDSERRAIFLRERTPAVSRNTVRKILRSDDTDGFAWRIVERHVGLGRHGTPVL